MLPIRSEPFNDPFFESFKIRPVDVAEASREDVPQLLGWTEFRAATRQGDDPYIAWQ